MSEIMRVDKVVIYKSIIQLCLAYLFESVILGSHHCNVYIEIPRDKSAVTDCSESRSADNVILDIIFNTHTVYLIHNLKLSTLQFFEFLTVHSLSLLFSCPYLYSYSST